MIAYLESSAGVKLLFKESESDALRAYLSEVESEDGRVVSSALLETELRRSAMTRGADQTLATKILDRLDIYDLERPAFSLAGILPGDRLRGLDALHVAAAMSIHADVMVSYDKRQSAAAEAAGLHVVSPSA